MEQPKTEEESVEESVESRRTEEKIVEEPKTEGLSVEEPIIEEKIVKESKVEEKVEIEPTSILESVMEKSESEEKLELRAFSQTDTLTPVITPQVEEIIRFETIQSKPFFEKQEAQEESDELEEECIVEYPEPTSEPVEKLPESVSRVQSNNVVSEKSIRKIESLFDVVNEKKIHSKIQISTLWLAPILSPNPNT